MKNLFEFVIEIIGWVRILLSPLLIGLAIGTIIYLSTKNNTGLAMGIIISVAGLLFGIVIATKAWKKQGTMNHLSKLGSTPELDHLEEDKTVTIN
ncbi:MAG: hypothetical protein Q8M15_05700 [Bacteroidota bacterium]|nr:hypothetical protein [Bacteroidota bacterium]